MKKWGPFFSNGNQNFHCSMKKVECVTQINQILRSVLEFIQFLMQPQLYSRTTSAPSLSESLSGSHGSPSSSSKQVRTGRWVVEIISIHLGQIQN